MIGYAYGRTWHLYPHCRGVHGERKLLPDGATVCQICQLRRSKLAKGKAIVKRHDDDGESYSEIGRSLGVSRQAVFQVAVAYREVAHASS